MVELDFTQFQPLAIFCFVGAVVHAFFVHGILGRANRLKSASGDEERVRPFLELGGHLTSIFAIWLLPVLGYAWFAGGGRSVVEALYAADLTEPFANFTFIFLALSRTVRNFFHRAVTQISRLFGGSPLAWWLSCLGVGVVLDGVISEIAAIVLVSSAMCDHFFQRKPSTRFQYMTLAVVVSVMALGNLVIPFNITHSMDLTAAWGWTHWTIAESIAWRALVAILAVVVSAVIWTRRDFYALAKLDEVPLPKVSTVAVLGYFLAFVVCGLLEHLSVVLVVVVAMVCVLEGGAGHQHNRRLMLPLIVALFNYSMELHAYFLSDTLAGLYEWVGESGATYLTVLLSGLNEHLPGTHMIESFGSSDGIEKTRALVAFCIGGGLALFSSSMNVVAYKLMKDSFPDGVVVGWRFLTYSVPLALVAYAALWVTCLIGC